MTLKMIVIQVELTDTGCKMGAYGQEMECPRCGVMVENSEHVCGDKEPKRKLKKDGSK